MPNLVLNVQSLKNKIEGKIVIFLIKTVRFHDTVCQPKRHVLEFLFSMSLLFVFQHWVHINTKPLAHKTEDLIGTDK